MDHIKGLLFDKDGTLFDFQATWGVWAASFFLELAKGDADLAAEKSLKLGYDIKAKKFNKDSVIISHTADEVAQEIGKQFPAWQIDELLAYVNKTAAMVPQVQPVPLIPLLKGFRARGLKLGVATNDAEAPAMAHLDRAGVTDLFDFIAGYDSGFGAKPEPGMQFGFCAAMGLEPHEVLMVGDSAHDLVSGRAAGMGTVGVLTGVTDAVEIEQYADVVMPDIGGIPEYLKFN
ncbi:MAG: phosphoglycolate phosphatase [Paracoccaceae bacterium]|jgi:phosphoglycolate phosphatase